MSGSQPSYFLTPDFDIPPPPHGPLRLGNIITNIKDPTYCLNSNEIILPLDSIVYLTFKQGFTATRNDVQQGKAGIWAKVAMATGLRGEASMKFDKASNDIFEVREIETTFFTPTQEYLEKSMNAPGVKKWLEASRWRKTVYMIVGLKIAKGISVRSSKFQGRGGQIEVKAGGAHTAVPLQAGAELSGSATNTQNSSFEESSDIVFGFRLRKIFYKRGRPINHEQFNVGAMFGEGERQNEQSPVSFVDITDVGDEDFSFEDLNDARYSSVSEPDGDQDCVWIVAGN
ncbi:uncharacterized protein PAC_06383 [Phialocephala subalpina]|uniref:Uncharacterized protein n=1 Tax=Phialocephala subalpina TaxID=576137 RepID=A0A1L7WUN2_9HELO|nr:uncharacterized protein PAC_06383 [Phialocephala subalpina]